MSRRCLHGLDLCKRSAPARLERLAGGATSSRERGDRGRIVCPFAFTAERTFEDQHVYEEKTVQGGSGGPEVRLRTASSTVTVQE